MAYRKQIADCISLVLLFILYCGQVNATRVEPTGRDTQVEFTFDKSSQPQSVAIWTNESGGYDTDDKGLWGRNAWVCLSSSSPAAGQCSTSVTGVKSGKTSIPLIFTEKRSGMTQIINLEGFHNILDNTGNGCSGSGVIGGPYQVYAANQINCYSTHVNDESQLTLSIPAQELSKIPVGGIWQADVKMSLMQWDPRIKLADWHAAITLNVSDTNNQQIYIPDFGTATPHVDLNLRPLPGTTGSGVKLNGSATLDLCLYDGYNSNSSEFIISPKDDYDGLPGRDYGLFSVYHDGKIDDSNRIDYKLEILDLSSRAYVALDNWQNYVAKDISSLPLRSVHLPGIPEAVLCVPTALRFTTPEFAITSKTAGHYTGTLHLTLTTQM
ncbi:MAG TPA: CfaE/CblD family pilus tip adhesin [Buttiauxella sp.]|nr:CfaE/CblD family pilus tip adhesin [Buttiauxella sp.]